MEVGLYEMLYGKRQQQQVTAVKRPQQAQHRLEVSNAAASKHGRGMKAFVYHPAGETTAMLYRV